MVDENARGNNIWSKHGVDLKKRYKAKKKQKAENVLKNRKEYRKKRKKVTRECYHLD